ncbi:hypothetical protein Tco_1445264 [Tanacetum coccineum]
MKKKDQISLDEETTLNLQAAFDEEERLAREKAEKEKEVNIALIETWDDIQAKIDVDHQLAERMQAQEQEELSIEEKATLFQQLLEKRRKHFAAKRAEEKRNKPPTKAQQRKIMCTYLKNMEGYKLKDLKLKELDYIQEMFDRAFKRVNTFEDFRTELVEGKENRAGIELVQESIKKQKHSMLNANSKLVCATCNECMFDAIHDLCVLDYLNDVSVRVKHKSAKPKSVKSKKKKVWKPTGKVFNDVGYRWKPTGRTFTIDGNAWPSTRITSNPIVPPKETSRPNHPLVLGLGCSNHMTGQRSQLINFVSKFMGTIRFRNGHVATIMGYGDYQI